MEKMNYIIWRWMQKEEKNLYYNPNYKNIVCEMKNQMLDWYLQTSDVVPRLQE